MLEKRRAIRPAEHQCQCWCSPQVLVKVRSSILHSNQRWQGKTKLYCITAKAGPILQERRLDYRRTCTRKKSGCTRMCARKVGLQKDLRKKESCAIEGLWWEACAVEGLVQERRLCRRRTCVRKKSGMYKDLCKKGWVVEGLVQESRLCCSSTSVGRLCCRRTCARKKAVPYKNLCKKEDWAIGMPSRCADRIKVVQLSSPWLDTRLSNACHPTRSQ